MTTSPPPTAPAAQDPQDPQDPQDSQDPQDPQAAVPDGEPPIGEEFLHLDRQICFSLHAASRAFNGVYRILLKDLGLTYPQYLVMLVLWERGELPVKRLGAYLRLDSGTLSPLLKRLESTGLVRRERSTEDERSVHVHLTEEGAALRGRALRVPRHVLAATGFSVDEIRDLHTRLDRLTSALDTAAADEDALMRG